MLEQYNNSERKSNAYSVNQENSCNWFGTILRFAKNIGVGSSIQICRLILDSRVLNCKFINHFDVCLKWNTMNTNQKWKDIKQGWCGRCRPFKQRGCPTNRRASVQIDKNWVTPKSHSDNSLSEDIRFPQLGSSRPFEEPTINKQLISRWQRITSHHKIIWSWRRISIWSHIRCLRISSCA